jgi:hypothetical protein
MDWDLAIKRNSKALKGIIEVLFAQLGLAGEATVTRIPRSVHSAVLRLLRPAESAMRRLIVIAARGLVVKLKPAASRPMPAEPIGKGGHSRPSFQLFDPRKNFAFRRRRTARRIPAPPPDGLVDAERLSRRLQALQFALEDLPRQARRLARWRLRRENAPSPKFRSPLRPGRPPGYRRKPVHQVDEVLAECHGLACYALMPDTS